MKRQTNAYDMFKLLKCNRKLSADHVLKIKKSIAARNMLEFRPVLVDSEMNVLDGQHRLEAAKLLGVPIWYEVQEDGTTDDIINFNAFQKSWGHMDFINYYAENGNKNYIKLKKFLETFKISPKTANRLVTNDHEKKFAEELALGKIIFDDERARIASRLMENVGDCMAAMKKASPLLVAEKLWMTGGRFKEALINFMMLEEVDYEMFMKKIPQRADLLSAKPGTHGYTEMFKAIYNYRNQNPIP
jgi:hypothetical protein